MPACPGARAKLLFAIQPALAFPANSILLLYLSLALCPAGFLPTMTRLGIAVSKPVFGDFPLLPLCALARLPFLAPSPAATHLFPFVPLRLGSTSAPPVSPSPFQIMLTVSSMSSTLEINDTPPSQAITNRSRMFTRVMSRFTRPSLGALFRFELQPLKGAHLSVTPPPRGQSISFRSETTLVSPRKPVSEPVERLRR